MPIFANLLDFDLSYSHPRLLQESDPVWLVKPGSDPLFGSEAFGDGSGLNGDNPRLLRCGWAVAD